MMALPCARTLALLGAAMIAGVVACATNEAKESAGEDGGTSLAPVDASVACDAGDSSACVTETDVVPCEEADWCPVPNVVDASVAATSISGTSASDVWLAGTRGTLLHFDGTAWTPSAPLATNFAYRSVWTSPTGRVWTAINAGYIYQSDGRRDANGSLTWTPTVPCLIPSKPTNARPIGSIFGIGERVFVDGYEYAYDLAINADAGRTYADTAHLWSIGSDGFCGNVGPSECMEGSCPRGSSVTTPSAAIWGTSPTEMWVLFGPRAFRSHAGATSGDGGAERLLWDEVSLQSKYDGYAVWGSSNADVWIAGDNGMLRHWTDGAATALIEAPTERALHGLWGTGPSDVWAVGDAGTVLHFDGTSWSTSVLSLPEGTRPNLYAIWGSSTDDVWIAGDGVVLRRHRREP